MTALYILAALCSGIIIGMVIQIKVEGDAREELWSVVHEQEDTINQLRGHIS